MSAPTENPIRARLGKFREAFDYLQLAMELKRGVKPSAPELVAELVGVGLRTLVDERSGLTPKQASELQKMLPQA